METSRVICVLGMHRSGTSCLAGTLEQGGLLLGDVQTHNAANLRGNRESPRIMALHDALLQANGFAWDRPPPPGRELVWNDESRRERDAIITEFADRPRWGFKDPRTLLAVAGWRETLPGLQAVGIFRHPLAVARSLQARGDMPLDRALELWLAYNRRLLDEWRATRLPVLSFDGSEEAFRAQVSALGEWLQFPGDLGGETFFAAELRHHRVEDDGALPAEVGAVYEELRGLALPAPAAGARAEPAPALSVVLPAGGTFRTLQSLRAGYQTGLRSGEYEVLVVGDGAPVAEFGAGFIACRPEEVRIRGRQVAILTDSAALLSPGVLQLAAELDADAILAAPGYEYDENRLAQTGWPHAAGSGRRLFDVSHPGESPDAYRFVAMSRARFEQIGRDAQNLPRLDEGVRWLLSAGEGTFSRAADPGAIALPDRPFAFHGRATPAARRHLGKSTDLPLAGGDGTLVAQLKAKNNELRAKIESLKQKNAELRARGDRWKEKAERC